MQVCKSDKEGGGCHDCVTGLPACVCLCDLAGVQNKPALQHRAGRSFDRTAAPVLHHDISLPVFVNKSECFATSMHAYLKTGVCALHRGLDATGYIFILVLLEYF